ncbi:MAG TPA: phytanoyl-CoA dioxygenase family protein [Candidatus Sulfotelmatobacter sp.]|nr:phytanoyl-CoA dioxygenase family protein [Candidatus Sulfotelmatobacter sp.]
MAASFARDAKEAYLAYARDGFFIEPDVFTVEECRLLIEHAEALAATSQGSVRRPLMHPHRQDPVFLEAMRKPRLVAIMAQLCGGAVAGLQTEFFFGAPGAPGFAPHQDNYFVEAPVGAFASAWAALVDVERDNGALYCYPGSHRLGLLPTVETARQPGPNQDPNATQNAAVVPDDITPVDVKVPQGSVVLLHGLVAHGSHANASAAPRYSFLSTYIETSAPYRPGRYAQRSKIALMPGVT